MVSRRNAHGIDANVNNTSFGELNDGSTMNPSGQTTLATRTGTHGFDVEEAGTNPTCDVLDVEEAVWSHGATGGGSKPTATCVLHYEVIEKNSRVTSFEGSKSCTFTASISRLCNLKGMVSVLHQTLEGFLLLL